MPRRTSSARTESGAQLGWSSTSTMLGGIVVWGGVGWLLDHWWGTRFATPIGAVVGMALGIYAVVARYGRMPGDRDDRSNGPADGSEPTSSER